MIKIIATIIMAKKVIKSDIMQNIIKDKENQEMFSRIVKRTLKKFDK